MFITMYLILDQKYSFKIKCIYIYIYIQEYYEIIKQRKN